jgi:hypothetical protein
MALADFLDFSKGEIEFELGDLVLSGDELKELLGQIERAFQEAPGILDCLSNEEKEALSMKTIRALQKAGLLPARYH